MPVKMFYEHDAEDVDDQINAWLEASAGIQMLGVSVTAMPYQAQADEPIQSILVACVHFTEASS